MKKEIWKDIVGYEEIYQVNNFGIVRRLYKNNKICILKQRPNSKGYMRVALCKNGIVQDKFMHHLVLESFIGFRLENQQCNHKDGNKINNQLNNLEWVSSSQNLIHSYKTLKRQVCKGSLNGQAKLKEKDILFIRKLDQLGFSQTNIAKIFNVTPTTINRVVNNKNWKHVN